MASVIVVSSGGVRETVEDSQKRKIITLSKVAQALSAIGLVVQDLNVDIGHYGELRAKIEAIVET